MDLTIRTASAQETRAAGAELAAVLRIHDVVVLTGELGAGKTTFVQGIARGVGATEHVTSPTFTLVREYVSGSVPLAHVDLFRLEREQDVIDLALDELEEGDGVLLVEWGDPVAPLLGDERLRVEMNVEDPSGSSETRIIRLDSIGPTWDSRADRIRELMAPWEAIP
jgi:tRNA threonylcarbamoyladenosine biosynthesis protein TsaE